MSRTMMACLILAWVAVAALADDKDQDAKTPLDVRGCVYLCEQRFGPCRVLNTIGNLPFLSTNPYCVEDANKCALDCIKQYMAASRHE
ncbi:hypothetical protein LSAT2_016775 [Lamellibrachia satsuma]|nr:hypothetical protein LSAT2_016775 [Lamellibrachia satsuma]